MLDNGNEEETMFFSEKNYKQKEENKTNEISSCRITHVRLRYYNSEDYISFKVLKDGTVQFWGYYEEQEFWDEIIKHEEMIVLKNELIPLLEYLQNLYPETTVELPQKNKNTDNRDVFIPEISFVYENYYSVIDNEIISLLKEISQFLQFTDNLVFTEEKIHSIFEKMAEFLLRVFIQHDKSVYDKRCRDLDLHCDYMKYYKIGDTRCYQTLCDLKKTLINKNLITNKELGPVR